VFTAVGTIFYNVVLYRQVSELPQMNKKLFKTGLIGTVIAAVCCFTPLLVALLSAIGLSAIIGWLDYVLLPALGIFIHITVYAFLSKSNEQV